MNTSSGLNKVKCIVFVSLNIGVENDVTAEWADDKLRVLEALGVRTVVVSGAASNPPRLQNMSWSKVWPIGFQDFSNQVELAQRQPVENQTRPSVFALLLSGSLGRLWDFLFRLSAGEVGSGRYSWVLSGTPVIAYHALRNKDSVIFSTGGPTGAHVAASVAAWLTGRPHYIEAQDPIVGSEMTLGPRATKVLAMTERFLVRNSTKTVLVTKQAAESTRRRNMKWANKVEGVYPGSWPHLKRADLNPVGQVFQFLHTGTLYGARNLDTFFLALDELYEEHPELQGQIEVLQKGGLFCENKSQYLSRGDFKLLALGNRIDALTSALSADALLLVQHTDTRSQETIPYKFYDYLNLEKPILALHENSELAGLVVEFGGFSAKNTDITEIKKRIIEIIAQVRGRRWSRPTTESPLGIINQFQELFSVKG